VTSRLETEKSLALFYIVLSYCQVLGFTLEEQDVIFRIISSILHLGNVYFHRKQLKHGE
jgi:myosin-15